MRRDGDAVNLLALTRAFSVVASLAMRASSVWRAVVRTALLCCTVLGSGSLVAGTTSWKRRSGAAISRALRGCCGE